MYFLILKEEHILHLSEKKTYSKTVGPMGEFSGKFKISHYVELRELLR